MRCRPCRCLELVARLVIVEEADPFVSEYRSELEDFIARVAGTLRVPSAPSAGSEAAAVRLLRHTECAYY